MKRVTKKSIDRLGVLLAEISDLQKEANEIKKALKVSGKKGMEGFLFDATVVHQQRTNLDAAKVRMILGDKVKLVERSIDVVSVKVTARKAA